MGKYIDADLLIAEIEQELSAHDKVDHLEAQEVGKAWNRGHRRALEDILEFITSLQQEQQEAELKVRAKYMKTLSNDVYVESEYLDIDPESVKMGDEVTITIDTRKIETNQN